MTLAGKIGIAITVIGGSALVFIKLRNKREIADIVQQINGHIGATGSFLDMRVSKAFNPDYARMINEDVKAGKKQSTFYTEATLNSKAALLNSSLTKNWVFFGNSDRELINRIITETRNQVQISQLVRKYLTAYNANLFDAIDNKLSDAEMNSMWMIVKNKPEY